MCFLVIFIVSSSKTSTMMMYNSKILLNIWRWQRKLHLSINVITMLIFRNYPIHNVCRIIVFIISYDSKRENRFHCPEEKPVSLTPSPRVHERFFRCRNLWSKLGRTVPDPPSPRPGPLQLLPERSFGALPLKMGRKRAVMAHWKCRSTREIPPAVLINEWIYGPVLVCPL